MMRIKCTSKRALIGVCASAILLVTASSAAGGNPQDAALKINDIQALGSHNSYKLPIPMPVFEVLNGWNPKLAIKLAYGHSPLVDQLDAGMRQLELDVYDDVEGGLFASPAGEKIMANIGKRTSFNADAMKDPGLKVFHIQEFDYLSSCPTFKSCLAEILRWSQAHPKHVPLMITINVKDSRISYPGAAIPAKFGAAALGRIDDEIKSVFPAEHLITPDDVRQTKTTLEESVLSGGWPLLERSRGKVYFVLDANDSKPAMAYRKDHPSLRDRIMFASYEPGQPEAAVMIINDAMRDSAVIKKRVTAGYIVRTRADIDSVDAVRKDKRRIKAAISAGAHYISTDYYRGAPDILRTGFMQTIDDNAIAICNKVRRTKRCKSLPE